MKDKKLEWAVIAAFILFVIFSSININIAHNTISDKAFFIRVFNCIGIFAGVIILPILLPAAGSEVIRAKLSKFGFRPAIAGLFFVPVIFGCFLTIDIFKNNLFLLALMNFFGGILTALVYGLFFIQVMQKRIFWGCLSLCLGLFIYYLLTEFKAAILAFDLFPFILNASSVFITLCGFFIFLHLTAVSNLITQKENMEPQAVKSKAPLNLQKKRFSMPLFLFPLLAVIIIFLINYFTERLFALNLYFPYNAAPLSAKIIILVSLPVLGILAEIAWRRFLDIFVILFSTLFMLTPFLLYTGNSENLNFVLYIFNNIFIKLMFIIFPFIILDLYRRDKYFCGGLYWLLALSVFLTRSITSTKIDIFSFVPVNNAYAVIILSFAAVVFYFLCIKTGAALYESSLYETKK